MKLIDASVRHPVPTAAAVALLLFFGTMALVRIPVQLTPTVEQPQITVSTVWPSGGPLEVEREIVGEQEKYLRQVEGLVRLESTSADGQGTVTLTFRVGTDLEAALLRVSNRLQQVRTYPPDAERPVLSTVDNQSFAMIWYAVVASDPGEEGRGEPFAEDVPALQSFLEDTLSPAFERIPGVANVDLSGGLPREMQVLVDPERLAAQRLTIPDLADALDRENNNFTGGDMDEGKRRFVVRTVGEYRDPEDIAEVVVAMRAGVPVRVGDVARVELGDGEADVRTFWMGKPAILVGLHREIGSSLVDVARHATEVAARVDSELLAPRGLKLVEARNEMRYLRRALSLVRQNLLLGGALAVLILLLFLRSRAATLIVAVAIPISLVGSFAILHAFGRTFNVISLAGMAFAIGMVIDNAIVVLEAIDRRHRDGEPRQDAARRGTQQVWGAILASTLTTVAVFLPVLFVREEAGQLFRDLALAISSALLISLLVSITVIPALAGRLLRDRPAEERSRGRLAGLGGIVDLAGRVVDRIAETVYSLCGTTARRLAVVAVLSGLAVGWSLYLVPETEYLPSGNRNFLFGLVQPPPGYNLTEVSRLQEPFVEGFAPLARDVIDPDAPGGGVWHVLFVLTHQSGTVVMNSRDPDRVRELIPEFKKIAADVPGAAAFMRQSTIFPSRLSRNIDIELLGPDFVRLGELGTEIEARVREVMPDVQVVPGSIDLSHPELQVIPHRRRAAELGLSNRDLGMVVAAMIDGVKVSEVRWEGREIDLRIRAAGATVHTDRLDQLPIATSDGRLVTLGAVADVMPSSGPASIRHVEQDRVVTVRVVPPEGEALAVTLERLDREVLSPLRRDGVLGSPYDARLSGAADKLTQTWQALRWNVFLAVVITYLLMTALFRSFVDPLVILFSVPLAALGGFLALAVLNVFTFQALDILTMLGFIILVGTVVNNAILIVHQALLNLRGEAGSQSSATPREAIREATRSRVRPIFMSATTSIFGMLPLALFPGAGAELYRGLGTVVVGGLAVSTIFTLLLIPVLLSLVIDAKAGLARRFSRDAA